MNSDIKIPTNELQDNEIIPVRKRKVRKKWLNWGVLFSLLALITITILIVYQYQINRDLRQALIQKDHVTEQQFVENKMKHIELTTRVEEVAKLTQTLSTFYQQINANEMQRLLTDLEQTLTMASEALYIAHDISSALKLLQYAYDKVKVVERTEMVRLQAALQHDIQTLSALPQVDLAKEMARIDLLLAEIDTLPLNIDIQRRIIGKPAINIENSQLPWWKRLGINIWTEMKSLVQIHRLDKPQQALLSMDQAMLLRENIKLRIISARIALLARNQTVYTADLQAVQKYIDSYFDQGQVKTKQALTLLHQLLTVQLVNETPNFTALAALRTIPMPALPKPGERG